MNKVVLSVDIGSSSLKAALIDATGNVLSYSRKSFLFRYTDHAAEEWFTALKSAAAELNAKTAGKQIVVDAICISGNGPTLVGETGETLFWNTPVEQTCESLFIDRIVEFKKRYNSSWNYGKYIFSGPEYLIWKLTDNALTILPEERYIKAYWTDEALMKAGLTQNECRKLPPYAAPGTSAGPLCASAAEFLLPAMPFLSPELEVYCGAPDFISALVGTNTLHAGALCDRAGSSEGINLCTDRPVHSEGLRTLPSIIPGLWNLSCIIPDSGSRFAFFRQKYERLTGRQNIPYAEFIEKILSEEECAKDPSLLEGKSLMQIILNEIHQGISRIYEAAENEGLKLPDEISLTGGQASNKGWNKLKAKAFGKKLNILSCTDAELLGDAAIAFTGMGLYASLQDAASVICSKIQYSISADENN